MERALAGQFDRSLKSGHSSGIWQVNDKGWEDDETHIDFDVSGSHAADRHAPICKNTQAEELASISFRFRQHSPGS